ncbi:Os04g0442950 [Oryza sativa Japonica Group]|uniref:Os04g0442950 protein n=1 Tax=Oryza sativa subsp. japonica TaxID=39947 RepID=C7J1D7_ORYSJ|nr:Os04g0442950 [Oryza sativa Japonica Group]|eukprot:NP_001173959.1 Os04g0442950 [Oryza sativa Japonica Group]
MGDVHKTKGIHNDTSGSCRRASIVLSNSAKRMYHLKPLDGPIYMRRRVEAYVVSLGPSGLRRKPAYVVIPAL